MKNDTEGASWRPYFLLMLAFRETSTGRKERSPSWGLWGVSRLGGTSKADGGGRSAFGLLVIGRSCGSSTSPRPAFSDGRRVRTFDTCDRPSQGLGRVGGPHPPCLRVVLVLSAAMLDRLVFPPRCAGQTRPAVGWLVAHLFPRFSCLPLATRSASSGRHSRSEDRHPSGSHSQTGPPWGRFPPSDIPARFTNRARGDPFAFGVALLLLQVAASEADGDRPATIGLVAGLFGDGRRSPRGSVRPRNRVDRRLRWLALSGR